MKNNIFLLMAAAVAVCCAVVKVVESMLPQEVLQKHWSLVEVYILTCLDINIIQVELIGNKPPVFGTCIWNQSSSILMITYVYIWGL